MTIDEPEMKRDKDIHMSLSNAAIQTIGTLLAAVATVIAEIEILRRRGPSRLRRLGSVLATLFTIIAVKTARYRGISRSIRSVADNSMILRHLRNPPQGWAAP